MSAQDQGIIFIHVSRNLSIRNVLIMRMLLSRNVAILFVVVLVGCKALPPTVNPTVTLCGSVVGLDGEGLEGVWVGLIRARGSGYLPEEIIQISEAVTGPAGSFHISTGTVSSGAGEMYWIAVLAERFVPLNLRTRQEGGKELIRDFRRDRKARAGVPEPPEMAPLYQTIPMCVIVEAGPKVGIRGLVRNTSSGNPVSAASVLLVRAESIPGLKHWTQLHRSSIPTGMDGSFEFWIRPAQYESIGLFCAPDGFSHSSVEFKGAYAVGAVIDDVKLQVTPVEMMTCAVEVVDPMRGPLRGFHLRVELDKDSGELPDWIKPGDLGKEIKLDDNGIGMLRIRKNCNYKCYVLANPRTLALPVATFNLDGSTARLVQKVELSESAAKLLIKRGKEK